MLETAMTIATTEGLEALTIARLCEALQMSIGGLYRYFPSKEAIYTALQTETILRFQVFWQEAVDRARSAATGADAQAIALQLVGVGFQAYLDHAVAVPVEHRLMDSFLSSPDQLLSDDQARQVETVLGPLVADFAGLFAAAAACGALAPGDALVRTHVTWAALHGLDHMRKRDRILPEALRVGALVTATMDALLIGWGADPVRLNASRNSQAQQLPLP
ncbi:MAG: helix-turn-helix transcriptional regulator [Candidatus Sericytochromatia bacterium]|nr:helix-turn-helix transcriptional regulator [Candidatus Sericytochromatia bacterium]